MKGTKGDKMNHLECAPIPPEILDPFNQWMESYIEQVKKETGFDFKNHTQEEWNTYYLSGAEKRAEDDEYFREILRMAKSTIDEKNYSSLVAMYRDYDQLVKEKLDRNAEEMGIDLDPKWKDLDFPYWCYSYRNASK